MTNIHKLLQRDDQIDKLTGAQQNQQNNLCT